MLHREGLQPDQAQGLPRCPHSGLWAGQIHDLRMQVSSLSLSLPPHLRCAQHVTLADATVLRRHCYHSLAESHTADRNVQGGRTG